MVAQTVQVGGNPYFPSSERIVSTINQISEKVKAVALKALYFVNIVVGAFFNSHFFAIGLFMGAVHPTVFGPTIASIQKLAKNNLPEILLIATVTSFYSLPLPFLLNSVLVGHHLGEKFRRDWCNIAG